MKIGQLIDLLKQYPADREVLVEGYETGFDPVHSLSRKILAGVQNAEDYDGLYDIPENLVVDNPSAPLFGVRAMSKKDSGERLECVVITGLRGQKR